MNTDSHFYDEVHTTASGSEEIGRVIADFIIRCNYFITVTQMSEWLDSQKKIRSNFREFLQERIKNTVRAAN